MGLAIERRPFADHHAFTPSDLAVPDGDVLLMTEKDAVKCAAFADARCYVVPVDAELPEAFWIALGERLGRPPGPPAHL